MRNLILILGDQLTPSLSALRNADPEQDRILMAEVQEEAHYTTHHRKKLVLVFSAMRHFARELEQNHWQIIYYEYQSDDSIQTLEDALAREISEHQPERLVVTHCGEWRLHRKMQDWSDMLGIPVEILDDDRFVSSLDEFQQWARGRKQLRMEFFYREMRRKTGLLMTAENKPEGGQWNYDADNRRKWTGHPPAPKPFFVTPDAITRSVIELVNNRFPDHFGTTEGFGYAVSRSDAREALGYFLDFALPCFGDFQDAMSDSEEWLFHSILSPYLNCGLLTPMEVCEAVEERYRSGQVPLNAAEGFIRQIIGWREFVRGIYWMNMPGYAEENRLNNTRALPWFYWSGETRMRCMHRAIEGTRKNGYAHHIQRLMVTGNFALLAGVAPKAICDWYLAVYVDAYDWVELPNTLGMVMHADGGYLGSKPYAASGKYIQRMSDHCRHCEYDVSKATGEDACPFNSLYWHFLDRHRDQFGDNHRMGMMYRNWDRQDPARRQAIIERGDWLLENIETL